MRGFWTRMNKTDFVLNNVLALALVALCAYFATQSDRFLQWRNFELILTNNAPIGVLCAVFALLVISGGIDLSVGSTIGLSGLVTAVAVTSWGVSDGGAFLLGVLVGAFIGSINGLLCGLLRFNPIIVTLGMLGVVRGAALLFREQDVIDLGGIFFTVANGHFLGVEILLYIVIAAFIISGAFVTLTPWGRYIYAIGLNPQAAYLSALPVRGLPFAMYTATGAAAGLCGVLISARLDGASAAAQGLTAEIEVLTIVLLGGIAFSGGRGRMFGVFIAWIFLGVLQNGLTLMNVTPYIQQVAAGLALVFAAALDRLGVFLTPRLRERSQLSDQMTSAEETAVSPGRRSLSDTSTSGTN
jgi:ribose/xylose/arabinose/galactoside ABC-type transport system permease subunit